MLKEQFTADTKSAYCEMSFSPVIQNPDHKQLTVAALFKPNHDHLQSILQTFPNEDKNLEIPHSDSQIHWNVFRHKGHLAWSLID